MARPPSCPEAVVRAQLRALRRALPGAAAGSVDAVHEARVATRRLREALAVLGGSGKAHGRLRRDLRRLRAALGPVRELDVALADVDALEQSSRVSDATMVFLREALAVERRRAQKRVRRRIEDFDFRKLRAHALRAARQVRPASAGAKGDSEVAWAHAAERASRLRRAIGEAGEDCVPGKLHAVRVAAKKLRYALEAACELDGVRPPPGMTKLRQAQDLLGRMHDLDVLGAWIRAAQALPRAAALPRSGDLERLTRRVDRECRQQHARYLRMRQSLQAVCDRSERTKRRRSRA